MANMNSLHRSMCILMAPRSDNETTLLLAIISNAQDIYVA